MTWISPATPSLSRLRRAPSVGAQQNLGETVGFDAVVLLGHLLAVGAQARLDVHERDAGGGRCERAGERGVGVPAHDHGGGAFGADQLFQAHACKVELRFAAPASRPRGCDAGAAGA